MSDMFAFYPYAARFGVIREVPKSGRSREELLGELREIAIEEDWVWETGRCSGTLYFGDRHHYAFLKEAFGVFAHQNALQRDMCPSATRFEGEIIAMAHDLMHAAALEDAEPAGMVTSGGSASIAQAMLAYREEDRDALGIERPNVVKPGTGHPAFDKACHLFGIELRRAPVDPKTTLVSPKRRRGADRREVADDRLAATDDAGFEDRRAHLPFDVRSEASESALEITLVEGPLPLAVGAAKCFEEVLRHRPAGSRFTTAFSAEEASATRCSRNSIRVPGASPESLSWRARVLLSTKPSTVADRESPPLANQRSPIKRNGRSVWSRLVPHDPNPAETAGTNGKSPRGLIRKVPATTAK